MWGDGFQSGLMAHLKSALRGRQSGTVGRGWRMQRGRVVNDGARGWEDDRRSGVESTRMEEVAENMRRM